MSNTFCRLLSNGYKINLNRNHLEWRPCCHYLKTTPLLNQQQFKAALEYTSSATTWLPECSQCRQMEESTVPGLSPRLISFRKIPNDMPAGACGALEINIDLICNAACLSCSGAASSTWKKYEHKHGLTNHVLKQDSTNAEKAFADLINTVDMSLVQDVFVLGGEPFYGDNNLHLLKHLHQVHPNLDQVTLRYQTNGSIIPEAEVLELWKSFKNVVISLSIDGIGDRFNYLRWPLKWHRVEKTVDFILSLTNASLTVNATVSPLNVLYFDEIETWVKNTIPKDRIQQRLYSLVRPNRCLYQMDLNLTTPELRQAVVDKYGQDHSVSKMFSNLEINTNCNDMFNHVNKHDRLRRLDWKQTFPGVVKYYTKYV
jgi:organic radical activating enzyme